MKKLTILVDVDETIVSLVDAWVQWLNNKYNLNICSEEIKHWDVAQDIPELTREQVYEALYQEELWYTVKPKVGASEFLQKLIADGHKVFLVTTNNYQTIKAKMEGTILRYFPFFTWNDVIITSHKKLIQGDVLIDDGVLNLEGGCYEKILINALYNEEYDVQSNGMYRTRNWDEVYSVINHIANKKEKS